MTTKAKAPNTGKQAEKAAAEPVLSSRPDEALHQFMRTVEELKAVYAEENAALLAADTKLFIALQDRKIAIVRNYQSCAQQIITRREEFKSASPAVRRQLQAMQEDFSRLAAVNIKAIERVSKSVQRLGARIMRAARESVQKKSVNYGATGNINKIERAVSLGFSESA
jgi:flagellar biosynthesis/type III secretory pathway chaperone